MTRILGLSHYLGHHHLLKQGLRLWFSNQTGQRFDDCVEIGARYGSRLQTFQVDRSTLDSHLLALAVDAGCDLQRPAKVTGIEILGDNGSKVSYESNKSQQMVRARWLIDASGRTAMVSRKLGYFRQNNEHPINAVWARFTEVKQWDSYDWRQKFPGYANECRTAREWATNHLMGHGWWCWIIPLRGGDVSAGIVYDNRLFNLPDGANLGERLHAHILNHPVGREIFGAANIIQGDVHALSLLPYYSEKVCDRGWAMVGDAAGFIDPLYSPGLDFCSYTSYAVADLVGNALNGQEVSDRLIDYNAQYQRMYRLWFEALYKDKYFYMGDAELMSAALLLDVSSYYLGLVMSLYRDPEAGFLELPFRGRGGWFFGGLMKFYNGRLTKLAKRRLATGHLGKKNMGWRELYDGFTPDLRVTKLLRKGLFRWWKAELTNLRLMLIFPMATPKENSEVAPAEA